jgi:hypothetical protein
MQRRVMIDVGSIPNTKGNQGTACFAFPVRTDPVRDLIPDPDTNGTVIPVHSSRRRQMTGTAVLSAITA